MNDEKVINLLAYLERNKENNYFLITSSDKKEPLLLKRIYAFIIDVACIFTLHTAIMMSFVYFVSEFYPVLNSSIKFKIINIPISMQLPLFLICYFFYFMFTQVTLSGKTIGQSVYSLKITDFEGKDKNDFKTITLRSIAYMGYYFGFGMFQLFYFINKRMFSDVLSKSTLSTPQINTEEMLKIEIDSLDIAA